MTANGQVKPLHLRRHKRIIGVASTDTGEACLAQELLQSPEGKAVAMPKIGRFVPGAQTDGPPHESIEIVRIEMTVKLIPRNGDRRLAVGVAGDYGNEPIVGGQTLSAGRARGDVLCESIAHGCRTVLVEGSVKVEFKAVTEEGPHECTEVRYDEPEHPIRAKHTAAFPEEPMGLGIIEMLQDVRCVDESTVAIANG